MLFASLPRSKVILIRNNNNSYNCNSWSLLRWRYDVQLFSKQRYGHCSEVSIRHRYFIQELIAMTSLNKQIRRNPLTHSIIYLINTVNRWQCTWIIDSDLLPSEIFCGDFCVLRYHLPSPPTPLSVNDFVSHLLGW